MTYNENFDLWLNNVSEVEKNELLKLKEAEKKEIFSNTLEFGTAGIRAVMGIGPSLLNQYTIMKTTNGLSKYLLKENDEKSKSVVIAHDCRNNSKYFSDVAAQCLIQHGIKVYQFSELVPTPLLSYMVRKLECDAGIMITASHNPKEFNGYKVYDNSGAQVNLEEANEIISYVENEKIEFSNFDEGILSEQHIIPQELIDEYLQTIKTEPTDKNLKIVFTPNHGTAYKLSPEILRLSGYKDVLEVKEQMQPDGNFTNSKSINPEEKDAFSLANQYMHDNDYDIALATDPDADRLGLAVNEDGNITLYTGNETGTLLIKYLIDTDNFTDNSVIYKTIVTGEMGAILAKEADIAVEETLTGFKFIGEKIRNEDKLDFIMGYEESYGYLFDPCVRDKDAIQATVMIADMVNYYKNKGLKVSDVLKSIKEKIGNYTEITYSYKVKDLNINKKVMDFYRSYNEEKLFGLEIEKKVDYLHDETGLPKSDVIKYFLKDFGWIVFRPSGTEPKIKMYVSLKAENSELMAEEIQEYFAIFLEKL